MMPIQTPGAIGSIETPDDRVREIALKVISSIVHE